MKKAAAKRRIPRALPERRKPERDMRQRGDFPGRLQERRNLPEQVGKRLR